MVFASFDETKNSGCCMSTFYAIIEEPSFWTDDERLDSTLRQIVANIELSIMKKG
jgi:hypothetical protein